MGLYIQWKNLTQKHRITSFTKVAENFRIDLQRSIVIRVLPHVIVNTNIPRYFVYQYPFMHLNAGLRHQVHTRMH